jgi:hypothetical protein
MSVTLPYARRAFRMTAFGRSRNGPPSRAVSWCDAPGYHAYLPDARAGDLAATAFCRWLEEVGKMHGQRALGQIIFSLTVQAENGPVLCLIA